MSIKEYVSYNFLIHTPSLGHCTELPESQQQLLRVPEDCQQLKTINISFQELICINQN